jgi:hypothetical protein
MIMETIYRFSPMFAAEKFVEGGQAVHELDGRVKSSLSTTGGRR